MIIVDAQLSPHLAKWIIETFKIECFSVKFLNLQKAEDKDIFEYAKKHNAIVMTKDEDFVELVHRFGSPPKIIWITCGNTSNEYLKKVLQIQLQQAISLLEVYNLVEISD